MRIPLLILCFSQVPTSSISWLLMYRLVGDCLVLRADCSLIQLFEHQAKTMPPKIAKEQVNLILQSENEVISITTYACFVWVRENYRLLNLYKYSHSKKRCYNGVKSAPPASQYLLAQGSLHSKARFTCFFSTLIP